MQPFMGKRSSGFTSSLSIYVRACAFMTTYGLILKWGGYATSCHVAPQKRENLSAALTGTAADSRARAELVQLSRQPGLEVMVVAIVVAAFELVRVVVLSAAAHVIDLSLAGVVVDIQKRLVAHRLICLLYTSPSPRDGLLSR